MALDSPGTSCHVCKLDVGTEKFSFKTHVQIKGISSHTVLSALKDLGIFNEDQTPDDASFVCKRCYKALETALMKKLEADDSVQKLKFLMQPQTTALKLKRSSQHEDKTDSDERSNQTVSEEAVAEISIVGLERSDQRRKRKTVPSSDQKSKKSKQDTRNTDAKLTSNRRRFHTRSGKEHGQGNSRVSVSEAIKDPSICTEINKNARCVEVSGKEEQNKKKKIGENNYVLDGTSNDASLQSNRNLRVDGEYCGSMQSGRNLSDDQEQDAEEFIYVSSDTNVTTPPNKSPKPCNDSKKVQNLKPKDKKSIKVMDSTAVKMLFCLLCKKKYLFKSSILHHIRTSHGKGLKEAETFVSNRGDSSLPRSKETVKKKRLSEEKDISKKDNQSVNRKRDSKIQHSDDDADRSLARISKPRSRKSEDKPWLCDICPKRYHHRRDAVRHIVNIHHKLLKDAHGFVKEVNAEQPQQTVSKNIISKIDIFNFDAVSSGYTSYCKASDVLIGKYPLIWQCTKCEKVCETKRGVYKHLAKFHHSFGSWMRYHVRQIGCREGETDKQDEFRLERDIFCVLCGHDFDNMYIAQRHFRLQHSGMKSCSVNEVIIQKSSGPKLIVLSTGSVQTIHYQIDIKGRLREVTPVDISRMEKKAQEIGQFIERKTFDIGNKNSTEDLDVHVMKSSKYEEDMNVEEEEDDDGGGGSGVMLQDENNVEQDVQSSKPTSKEVNQLVNRSHSLPSGELNDGHKCHECSRVFRRQKFLDEHIKRHKEMSKWICKRCGVMYYRNFILLGHIHTVHKVLGLEALDLMEQRSAETSQEDANGIGSNMDDGEGSSDEGMEGTGEVVNRSNVRLISGRENTDEENKTDNDESPMNSQPRLPSQEGGLLFKSQTLICEFCKNEFEFIDKLIDHLKVSHDISSYRCTECCQVFLSLSVFHCHIKLNHRQLWNKEYQHVFTCVVCQTIFPTKRSLASHVKSHKNGEIKCPICSKECPAISKLSCHMKHHNLTQTVYSCSICSVQFEKAFRLERHVMIHFKKFKDIFYCSLCHKEFADNNSLSRHRRTSHSCVCDQCGKMFESIASLRNHVKLHTDPDSFECKECNKSFTSVSGYRKHMYKHRGKSSVVCHLCGKSLHKASLEKHIQLKHTTQKTKSTPQLKNRTCKYCDKTFKRPCELERHLVVHTKERPFECEFCTKTFGNRWMCLTHLRTHPEYVPYTCTECGKSFQMMQKYMEHRQQMHPGLVDDQYSISCEICKRIFKSKRALALHMDERHKEEQVLPTWKTYPYSCEKCRTPFLYKLTWKRHNCDKKKSVKGSKSSAKGNKKALKDTSVSQVQNSSEQVMNETDADCILYKCSVCTECFVEWDELKSHMDVEHANYCNIKIHHLDPDRQEEYDVERTVKDLDQIGFLVDTECDIVVSTE